MSHVSAEETIIRYLMPNAGDEYSRARQATAGSACKGLRIF